MNKEQCLVHECRGEYITHIVNNIKLRNGKSVNVTETICNVCGDDYDTRLVRFIRENWN